MLQNGIIGGENVQEQKLSKLLGLRISVIVIDSWKHYHDSTYGTPYHEASIFRYTLSEMELLKF